MMGSLRWGRAGRSRWRQPRRWRSTPNSMPARSRRKRWRSPARSASTTNRISRLKVFDRMAIPLPEATSSSLEALTPRQIVAELDKHVVGQKQAKRAVAIALRNRSRRQKLAARAGRRNRAEEHPDDRADRRRQDRDRPAAGETGAVAVHQGRSVQVHRGRLRRAATSSRWCATSSRSPSRWSAMSGAPRCARRRARRPKSACWTCCCRRCRRRANTTTGHLDPRAGAADAREAARAAARRPARSQASRDRRPREVISVVRDHRRFVGRRSRHQRQGHDGRALRRPDEEAEAARSRGARGAGAGGRGRS